MIKTYTQFLRIIFLWNTFASIKILEKNGTINQNGIKEFIGLDRFDARKLLIEKLKMSGLRIYLSAKNPLVFSNWLGLDPENAGAIGVSNPLFRTINLGTNINF